MILIEETDKRFYIKESTIPQAGLGVFAKEPLRRGDYLEIIGARVKYGSIADACTHYANPYKFSSRGGPKDDYIVPMGYAAIINHAPVKEVQNCCIDINRNPPRNPAAGIVVYRFLRDINKDEELFGHYGDNWDVALKWAAKAAEVADEFKDDWETFLEFDLYNLNSINK